MKAEISDLFSQLSDAEPTTRERYYQEHDVPEDVRREVESLLAFDGGRPIRNLVEAAVGIAFQEPVSGGDMCGPFRLLRVLGRGGMGVVYLAERTDREVRQQVAVKLLGASLDSGTSRERFLQERQILATLEHPNIARLIDAGRRADGQPWLAMEYVDGQRIDDHCRELSTRHAVTLMGRVCDAIASAHQRLVVHRDLKPGNILVDREGNPRVLDFGIARLLDSSEVTATIDRRLTPEYASPEQMLGAPATTAADIYSLGAVLRVLVAEQADRDLQAIIQKATRVEPNERYGTADKLGDDLRAWLDGRPVEARRGEAWYVARRTLRRYWGPALAGLVATGGLVAGLVIARAERDFARQRFDDVRRLANELFVLEKEIQPLPGSTSIRERVVRNSIAYLENLSKNAGNDWRLKLEIAAGYRKAAESQGVLRGINLGRPADARESLRRSGVLIAEAEAAAGPNRQVLRDRVELLELLTRMDYDARDLRALQSRLGEMQDALTRYEASAPDDPSEWQFLGKQYETMAVAAKELSRVEVPARFAKRSVELRRRAAAADSSVRAQGSLGNALSAYATLQRMAGDFTGALATSQESLGVFRRIVVAAPDHYVSAVNLANTLATIGRTLGDPNGPSLGRRAEAIPFFEESLRNGRKLMTLDAADNQIRLNHAVAAWRFGDVLRATDPARALASYDEAIAVLRPVTTKLFMRNISLAAVLSESTLALRALGRMGEVRERLAEAAGICEATRTGTSAKQVYETCREHVSRAEAAEAMAQGRVADAVAIHQAWFALSEPAARLADAREDSFAAFVLANRYALLRDALRRAGRHAEAEGAEASRRAVPASTRSGSS